MPFRPLARVKAQKRQFTAKHVIVWRSEVEVKGRKVESELGARTSSTSVFERPHAHG